MMLTHVSKVRQKLAWAEGKSIQKMMKGNMMQNGRESLKALNRAYELKAAE